MGELYDEFESTLQAWRHECAGRPRDEMVRLFLLALEREQLVSTGYREALLRDRLDMLDVPPDVRDLMRHALLWAWKDEEMHTVYIRGVLLRLARGPRLVRTALQQLGGAVGGWASSVRQHVPWRRAPLASTLAAAVTAAGIVAGKVPRGIRRQLVFGPFRDFCVLNVDAERTASRCWERLVELGTMDPALPTSAVDEFRRMKRDEDSHARVFQALADVLDPQDRLRPGEDAASLARRLAEAGPFFLPPERRPAIAGEPRPGTGGTVHVLRGATADDKLPTLERLLDAVDLRGLLAERAHERGRARDALRVAIKPTFMIGYSRRDLSCLTDPALVAALVRRLREEGVARVDVIDSPTIYDRFYAGRSVREVAGYFGFGEVVDASQDQVPHTYVRGMAQHTISRTWRDADVRISFAKMRTNAVDMATLTVATLEGLGPRQEEYFFAERQAHRDTVNMMVLAEFPPHLALLDAYDSASDGILGMMGNPRPHVPRRLYAARDPLALDVVALRHMGLSDPDRSATLLEARHWFGDVRPRVRVEGVDEPIPGWRGPWSRDRDALLSLVAYPVYQFGSGRGALFVPQMDEAAFPPVTPSGPMLRLGRWLIQSAFGLRLPR